MTDITDQRPGFTRRCIGNDNQPGDFTCCPDLAATADNTAAAATNRQRFLHPPEQQPPSACQPRVLRRCAYFGSPHDRPLGQPLFKHITPCRYPGHAPAVLPPDQGSTCLRVSNKADHPCGITAFACHHTLSFEALGCSEASARSGDAS